MSEDKSKYLELDKEFRKKFGMNYVGPTQKDVFEQVNFFPLKCFSWNRMLGGGVPEGRLIEIYGGESVGKTTLSYMIASSFQQQQKAVFFIDAEHSFSKDRAEVCGINVEENWCYLKPESGNEALEAIRYAAASGVISLIILDSVASLVPEDEYDKDIGGGQIGSLARLMSHSLKQIISYANRNNCTVIFLNQERATNLASSYGKKSGTTGGNALKYYASVKIDLNRSEYLEEKGSKIGIKVKAKTEKNKTFTPFKEAEVNILFSSGVDLIQDVIDNAIEEEVVEKRGAWFKYKDIYLQGMAKFKVEVESRPEIYEEIYKNLVNKIEKKEKTKEIEEDLKEVS